MEPNYGIFIGLITVLSGVSVLGLSYLGAYLLGHSRGRREAELDQRAIDRDMAHGLSGDRTAAIEGSLASMAQAIERLTDAQRVALLDRMRTPGQQRASGRIGQHDTPA